MTKHTSEALSIKYVGLDVHKETIAVAVADNGTLSVNLGDVAARILRRFGMGGF